MKKMTCKQLGGACDLEFFAESFDEMAKLSKDHGTKMFELGDEDHLKAMTEMMTLMQSPDAMDDWFTGKRKEFESLPDLD